MLVLTEWKNHNMLMKALQPKEHFPAVTKKSLTDDTILKGAREANTYIAQMNKL